MSLIIYDCRHSRGRERPRTPSLDWQRYRIYGPVIPMDEDRGWLWRWLHNR